MTASEDRILASFVIHAAPDPLPETDAEIGINRGRAVFAALSDGTVIDNPRILWRAERLLRKAQQSLFRKENGSRNQDKARVRLARATRR